MSKDTIYRQDAIDALKNMMVSYEPLRICINRSERDRTLRRAINVMSVLPSAQAEQRWIPCSEKIPDIGTEVLVTDYEVMWICNLFESPDSNDGRYQWEDNYGHWYEFDRWDAWMTLPPPLKEVTK